MIKGVGIDFVEIERVRKALESGKEHFLSRVFTLQEIEYCQKGKDAFQKYAARFAAKEATMKALGTGWGKGVNWKDIEVVSDREGVPQLVLRGKSQEIFEKIGARTVHISLTHHKTLASAIVIIES